MRDPEQSVDLLMMKRTCHGTAEELIGAPPTTCGALRSTLADAASTGMSPNEMAAPRTPVMIRRLPRVFASWHDLPRLCSSDDVEVNPSHHGRLSLTIARQ
jgi:hypothetical protein